MPGTEPVRAAVASGSVSGSTAGRKQLLPTDHCHVIFTLPSELHELWQWNRAALTAVLFGSVRETLLTLLGDPKWLGATPGILAALHTWGGRDSPSACALPGQWRRSGPPRGSGARYARGICCRWRWYGALFRGKVLGALEQLWLTGLLPAAAPPPTMTAYAGYSWLRRGKSGTSAWPSVIRMAGA